MPSLPHNTPNQVCRIHLPVSDLFPDHIVRPVMREYIHGHRSFAQDQQIHPPELQPFLWFRHHRNQRFAHCIIPQTVHTDHNLYQSNRINSKSMHLVVLLLLYNPQRNLPLRVVLIVLVIKFSEPDHWQLVIREYPPLPAQFFPFGPGLLDQLSVVLLLLGNCR